VTQKSLIGYHNHVGTALLLGDATEYFNVSTTYSHVSMLDWHRMEDLDLRAMCSNGPRRLYLKTFNLSTMGLDHLRRLDAYHFHL
jgi:hypothetical protein